MVTWLLCVFCSCLCMSWLSGYIEAKKDYESHDVDWLLGWTDKHVEYLFVHCLWYLICIILTSVYCSFWGLDRAWPTVWCTITLLCSRAIHIWLHDGVYMETKNEFLGINVYKDGFTTDLVHVTVKSAKSDKIFNLYKTRKIFAITGITCFIINILIKIIG